MTSILDNISGDDALCVLRALCAADEDTRDRVLREAERVLKNVDRDDIADNVVMDLNALDVEDLWDCSGRNRDGYSTPDEMALEMAEEVLQPYVDRVKLYQKIGMPEQSKQYCMGVLKGIYQFALEPDSEFKDQAPDIPAACFGGILDKWRRHCTQDQDVRDMNEFLSRECPNWAK